jgi:superfamily I DNA and/or RNA helicase
VPAKRIHQTGKTYSDPETAFTSRVSRSGHEAVFHDVAQIMSFDVVVIDEASQMKPEDSLGGLLRAKKVVVVGDPNQLPPSDFFARVTPPDEGGADSGDEDDIDAESILDWSLKTFHAPRRLKWHYRSRCESLIAFSNRKFYASRTGSHGDLITFPTARPGGNITGSV